MIEKFNLFESNNLSLSNKSKEILKKLSKIFRMRFNVDLLYDHTHVYDITMGMGISIQFTISEGDDYIDDGFSIISIDASMIYLESGYDLDKIIYSLNYAFLDNAITERNNRLLNKLLKLNINKPTIDLVYLNYIHSADFFNNCDLTILNKFINYGIDWSLKTKQELDLIKYMERNCIDEYQKLIKKYPEKYNKYLKRQTSNKFNL